MNKEKYQKPKTNIVKFSNVNVITTSGTGSTGGTGLTPSGWIDKWY